MIKDVEERLLSTPAKEAWLKIGIKHHHGICLPLFSLHSANSCGIGEYLDLLPLLPWCQKLGLDVIQLLPLNDTGIGTSPYSALSAFALNPLFLSIQNLPHIEEVPNFLDKIHAIQKWNESKRIKYDLIRQMRYLLLQEWFPYAYENISKTKSFQNFITDNPWLKPYALFKSISETQKWSSWETWPLSLKSPSEKHYQALLVEFSHSMNFHILIQYFCYQQLRLVKQKAEEFRICLKGDIPILISRDSADVWYHRNLFFMHLTAGAPPDAYAKEGQNWGFPVYDWDEQEKDNYYWWKERLRWASQLYHIYRIDHIVGFFRLWAIPLGKPGIQGSFIPSEPHQWIPSGKKIMQMMLQAVSMLPIGEDLGTVPNEVRECLKEIGICGTKLMRWERRWEEDSTFIPVTDYPPESMTTVSTHDSDTLQLWWKHSPKEAKVFCQFKEWDYKPFLSLEQHREILYDSHHSSSFFHINLLQEYLALYPELVSLQANDERINIPGKVLDTNWTYRFRPSVEEIISHSGLENTFKKLL